MAPDRDVQAFIEKHNIDPDAAARLLSETPEIQRAVLDRGSLTGANNVAAVLMTRIKKAKEEQGGGGGGSREYPRGGGGGGSREYPQGGGGGGGGGSREYTQKRNYEIEKPDVAEAAPVYHSKKGDWDCPKCGDVQFAKNTACRKCNTPKPASDAGRNGEAGRGLAKGERSSWEESSSWSRHGDRDQWDPREAAERPRRGRSRGRSPNSDSSVESAGRGGSPATKAARGQPMLSVLYWGTALDKESGWDFTRSCPKLCRQCDDVYESWRGRMENMQLTLRICASEGPGFKRYMRHFMALSLKGCAEFHFKRFHNANRERKKKVLTERVVIGGILEAAMGMASQKEVGIRVSNGAPDEDWSTFLTRRSKRYRKQARRAGGHFAVLLLEGGGSELNLRDMLAVAEKEIHHRARIQRLLIVLGGPDGIKEHIREGIRNIVEDFTDFPLLSVALPGGMLHSYYALANILIFHDQRLLIPYLQAQAEEQVTKNPAWSSNGPCERPTAKARPGVLQAKPPMGPPPAHLAKPPMGPPPAHLMPGASEADSTPLASDSVASAFNQTGDGEMFIMDSDEEVEADGAAKEMASSSMASAPAGVAAGAVVGLEQPAALRLATVKATAQGAKAAVQAPPVLATGDFNYLGAGVAPPSAKSSGAPPPSAKSRPVPSSPEGPPPPALRRPVSSTSLPGEEAALPRSVPTTPPKAAAPAAAAPPAATDLELELGDMSCGDLRNTLRTYGRYGEEKMRGLVEKQEFVAALRTAMAERGPPPHLRRRPVEGAATRPAEPPASSTASASQPPGGAAASAAAPLGAGAVQASVLLADSASRATSASSSPAGSESSAPLDKQREAQTQPKPQEAPFAQAPALHESWPPAPPFEMSSAPRPHVPSTTEAGPDASSSWDSWGQDLASTAMHNTAVLPSSTESSPTPHPAVVRPRPPAEAEASTATKVSERGEASVQPSESLQSMNESLGPAARDRAAASVFAQPSVESELVGGASGSAGRPDATAEHVPVEAAPPAKSEEVKGESPPASPERAAAAAAARSQTKVHASPLLEAGKMLMKSKEMTDRYERLARPEPPAAAPPPGSGEVGPPGPSGAAGGPPAAEVGLAMAQPDQAAAPASPRVDETEGQVVGDHSPLAAASTASLPTPSESSEVPSQPQRLVWHSRDKVMVEALAATASPFGSVLATEPTVRGSPQVAAPMLETPLAAAADSADRRLPLTAKAPRGPPPAHLLAGGAKAGTGQPPKQAALSAMPPALAGCGSARPALRPPPLASEVPVPPWRPTAPPPALGVQLRPTPLGSRHQPRSVEATTPTYPRLRGSIAGVGGPGVLQQPVQQPEASYGIGLGHAYLGDLGPLGPLGSAAYLSAAGVQGFGGAYLARPLLVVAMPPPMQQQPQQPPASSWAGWDADA